MMIDSNSVAMAPIQLPNGGTTNLLQLTMLRRGLQFELKTGMKMTREGTLPAAKRLLGLVKRANKKQVLAVVEDYIEQVEAQLAAAQEPKEN